MARRRLWTPSAVGSDPRSAVEGLHGLSLYKAYLLAAELTLDRRRAGTGGWKPEWTSASDVTRGRFWS